MNFLNINLSYTILGPLIARCGYHICVRSGSVGVLNSPVTRFSAKWKQSYCHSMGVRNCVLSTLVAAWGVALGDHRNAKDLKLDPWNLLSLAPHWAVSSSPGRRQTDSFPTQWQNHSGTGNILTCASKEFSRESWFFLWKLQESKC